MCVSRVEQCVFMGKLCVLGAVGWEQCVCVCIGWSRVCVWVVGSSVCVWVGGSSVCVCVLNESIVMKH